MFSEISNWVSPIFLFLLGKDVIKNTHGQPVTDKGERLVSCITAMGSRVPA